MNHRRFGKLNENKLDFFINKNNYNGEIVYFSNGISNIVKELRINIVDNTIFDYSIINENLENLTLIGNHYNIDLSRFKNLKYLHVYSETFNQNIDNLPASIKDLRIFCKSFNQSLNYLPEKLETLSLSLNKKFIFFY